MLNRLFQSDQIHEKEQTALNLVYLNEEMANCTFQPNIKSDFVSLLPSKRKFKKFLVDQ